jgi:hypothetical protein
MDDNKRELSIHGSSQHSVNIAGDQNVMNVQTVGAVDMPVPKFWAEGKWFWR